MAVSATHVLDFTEPPKIHHLSIWKFEMVGPTISSWKGKGQWGTKHRMQEMKTKHVNKNKIAIQVYCSLKFFVFRNKSIVYFAET